MKVNDIKLLKNSILEKVITRIYLGIDNDILQLHYEFLSKTLFDLFLSQNREFEMTSGKWQFLNRSQGTDYV